MNKFDKFYEKKPIRELLEKVQSGKINPETIDLEWYEGLLTHLKNRDMTDKQKEVLETILSSSVDELKSYIPFKEGVDFTKGSNDPLISENKPPIVVSDKYSSLETTKYFLMIFGIVLILIGVVSLVVYMADNIDIMGVVYAVSNFIFGAIIIAMSNMITVFVDIANNSAVTNDLLSKMNDKNERN